MLYLAKNNERSWSGKNRTSTREVTAYGWASKAVKRWVLKNHRKVEGGTIKLKENWIREEKNSEGALLKIEVRFLILNFGMLLRF